MDTVAARWSQEFWNRTLAESIGHFGIIACKWKPLKKPFTVGAYFYSVTYSKNYVQGTDLRPDVWPTRVLFTVWFTTKTHLSFGNWSSRQPIIKSSFEKAAGPSQLGAHNFTTIHHKLHLRNLHRRWIRHSNLPMAVLCLFNMMEEIASFFLNPMHQVSFSLETQQYHVDTSGNVTNFWILHCCH